MTNFDEISVKNTVSSYLQDEGLLENNPDVLVWPSETTFPGNVLDQLAGNDRYGTVYAAASEEDATRNDILSRLGLRRSRDLSNVEFLQEESGSYEQLVENYSEGRLPQVDIEIGWPAKGLEVFDDDQMWPRYPSRGDLDHVVGNRLREMIRNSGDILRDDGVALYRVDDVITEGIGYHMGMQNVDEFKSRMKFWMGSEFGFDDLDAFGELETDHMYVVGRYPKS